MFILGAGAEARLFAFLARILNDLWLDWFLFYITRWISNKRHERMERGRETRCRAYILFVHTMIHDSIVNPSLVSRRFPDARECMKLHNMAKLIVSKDSKIAIQFQKEILHAWSDCLRLSEMDNQRASRGFRSRIYKFDKMTLDKCQIITHITHPLTYTPFDVKWLPCSAKFAVIGQLPRGTGIIQVYELQGASIKLLSETEQPSAFKACTLGASSLSQRHLATGDFDGRLCTWDLERLSTPLTTIKAHDQIINTMDGCGGIGVQNGPPEIATGSRDGTVKVWDVRVKDKPVATISPAQGEASRDVWAVAFGTQQYFVLTD